MEQVLNAVEARVLGCLIEKERTTPEYYPLTKKSLLAACNQRSNRDPEMHLTETVLDEALDSLRYKHKLVATVTQANSRVLKYRHELLSHYKFDPEDVAVICELLLRGPQTAGALRTHTKRMVEIGSPARVKEILDQLMHWGDTAFVTRIPPARGMREERYAHLFCGEPKLDEVADGSDAHQEPQQVSSQASVEEDPRIEALENKVADLEARLSALEQELL